MLESILESAKAHLSQPSDWVLVGVSLGPVALMAYVCRWIYRNERYKKTLQSPNTPEATSPTVAEDHDASYVP